MDNVSRHSGKGRRRRRSSRRGKSINFSKLAGIALILLGIFVSLYSFDVLGNFKEMFTGVEYKNYFQLWPIIIILLGFVFVIKDYVQDTSSNKWK